MSATNSNEYLVDQATQAMRNQGDSEEYAEQVSLRIQNLIDAQPEQAQEKRTSWLRGFLQSMAKAKLRTASAFSAVGAVGIATLLFLGSTSTPLYADMVAKLRDITSLTYQGSMHARGEHLMDINVFYQHPDKVRVETLPSGSAEGGATINIMDIANGQGQIIFPEQGMNVPYQFDPEQNGQTNEEEDPLAWYDTLLNADPSTVTTLDSIEVDGKLLTGFLVEEQGTQVRVWVDANTELPVRLNVLIPGQSEQATFELQAELTFNETIDENLFQY
ncbi:MULTISPECIES: hypothetical protein [Gammaproteobacteria]|uniref:hypothetical protein n=1 Tax=Gammaproteobacteria TaxID=1236 RepID=UPI000DCFB669|nr:MULTISPECIES: hypothetical protein [Gammaproteobacteria]RTE86958.1 hypothetical protein DQX04_00785 [Aliidiomarina sp. B3213]TCZ93252.1 hypothetical protein EYQ95_04515 [Lysobacter sp. N42]